MDMAAKVDLRGCVLVTCLYFIVYYVFLILGLFAKIGSGARRAEALKKADGDKFAVLNWRTKDLPVKRTDRSQLNMLEQMPPFLVAMWMYALFVDPVLAAQLGFLYTALRALYFPLYTWKLHILVTIPN
eukprot:CAMPEP_0205829038 /NCGR_PEP_ID=MMETSP0206-20130828/36839_1 /ASSEMBLY_ACC=CAM_ASM_000279 /TAXON_ID=36767 /ORGANISM="Euplotes focardii, Strain TN1" /LENGTH=128 /DNA_ID=CAMNT_0053131397 /DNA_START=29 /DNA_END=412 /DNA_ORIENTATION=+